MPVPLSCACNANCGAAVEARAGGVAGVGHWRRRPASVPAGKGRSGPRPTQSSQSIGQVRLHLLACKITRSGKSKLLPHDQLANLKRFVVSTFKRNAQRPLPAPTLPAVAGLPCGLPVRTAMLGHPLGDESRALL